MISRRLRLALLVPLFALPVLAPALAPAVSAAAPHWVSTWTAPADTAGPALPAETIRQVVRTSTGGAHVRVRLSNLFGTAPLAIGAARIALHAAGAAIVPGTDHALTFAGAPTVTIAPGATVVSDAVAMQTAALQELAVSLYLPAGTQASTLHGVGMQTAYFAPGTDRTGAIALPAGATDDSRYFLTDVDVDAEGGTWAIAVVGDSIVDGVGSTQDAHARWPDVLARTLRERSVRRAPAVVGAGIAGNRLLRDASAPFVGASLLSRFERDALDKPGVRWIVLAQGINDIVASDMLKDPAQQASAQQIIDGMQRLVARAHARGVKVCGATLLPYAGVKRPFIHSAAGEAKRLAVNAWIRTPGNFDAVLDADGALRDPAQPERLLPRFDSGDHLHPNDAGHAALAEAASDVWRDRL